MGHGPWLAFNSIQDTPYDQVESLSRETVPVNFDRWSPSADSGKREETGIIHNGLKVISTNSGERGYALVIHPQQMGVKISFPLTPLSLSNNCNLKYMKNRFITSVTFLALFVSIITKAQSFYEEPVCIPDFDSTNPAMMIIDNNDDWAHINDATIRYFYVAPGNYSAVGRVEITSSGTGTEKRYLSLYNGNDLHPGKLPIEEVATVRLLFRGAQNWVVDRMSYLDPYYSNWILDFQDGAKDIIINRQLIRDTNSGAVYVRNGTESITIQKCRFDRTRFTIVTDLAAIMLGGADNTVIKNVKVLDNEIVNYNDPVQTVRMNPQIVTNDNHEGLIIDNNHFYADDLIYTDCSGNPQQDGPCLYGENALDFKAGSENPNNPVLVTNNKMWGYRRADRTGSSMSSNGNAIVLHFNVENIKIRDNVIFDSFEGIRVGARESYPHILMNGEISNNIFYNLKKSAFIVIFSKSFSMNNNLFKNIGYFDWSAGWGETYGAFNMLMGDSTSFCDNTISNGVSTQYVFHDEGSRLDTVKGNIAFGVKDQGLAGFEYPSDDPTSGYGDLVFTTDRYTNSPRTIKLTKVLESGKSSFTVDLTTDGTPGAYLSGETSQVVDSLDDCSTVTVNVPSGYIFENWTGTGDFATTTSNPLTVTNVTAAMTITANFKSNGTNSGISNDTRISIYPNPTSGIINIESANSDIQSVAVTDMSGKLIMQQATATNHLTINLSDQPAGIYFIEIHANDEIILKKVNRLG
ncbi:MAG: T9SS type A sorting domain-containing protein [Bacteroidota bacterium]